MRANRLPTIMGILGLEVMAAILASVFNIWIWPPIQSVVFGNSCTQGKITGEMIVLLVSLGLLLGGLGVSWTMRTWPLTLTRKLVFTFLVGAIAINTGGLWFFLVLIDLMACLRGVGL